MFRGSDANRAEERGRAAPRKAAARERAPFLVGLALALLTIAVVALGVYPSPLLSFIGSFTAAP